MINLPQLDVTDPTDMLLRAALLAIDHGLQLKTDDRYEERLASISRISYCLSSSPTAKEEILSFLASVGTSLDEVYAAIGGRINLSLAAISKISEATSAWETLYRIGD